MQSLHTSRAPVANAGYHGPRDMAAYARKLGREAAAEQARMDLIRARQLRKRAGRVTR